MLDCIGRLASKQRDFRMLLGPGDDCALAKITPGRALVITTDEMVEGTHFKNPAGKAKLIARKLLRINLSDFAGMGDVKPVCVVCGASFPPSLPWKWVRDFTSALIGECKRFGVFLAGGNLARSAKIHVYITAMGEASPGNIVRRSGAVPGDLIFGMGKIGEARAGLELSQKSVPAQFKDLLQSFWLPQPCLEEARLIGRMKLASSMMDNSDGLYKSVATLAKSSGCGAYIEVMQSCLSVPLEKYCRKTGKDWKRYVISGGEDYGLILTVKPRNADKFIKHFPRAYALGLMTEGNGVKCHGYENPKIFEHF